MEQIMSDLTPENARKLFTQLHERMPKNTESAYIGVKTPSGCELFIPVAFSEEKYMEKHKGFYQELLDKTEY